jgi:hypothetical protein
MLDLIAQNDMWCGVQVNNPSLGSFLHSPVNSFPYAQIFSSAHYSQTLSASVLLSIWATSFHTHSKQQAKLQLSLYFWLTTRKTKDSALT